jgi:hypothetical protein
MERHECKSAMTSPKVLISYSHDSEEHRQLLLGLAQRLRQSDGIEANIDQYVPGSPEEGWPRWMLNEIDSADFVLVICSNAYYRRFRGHEEPGKGKGSDSARVKVVVASFMRPVAA